MKNQIRHGDVFLERVQALPAGAVRVTDGPRINGKSVILAFGEMTGHMHRVDQGELYTVGDTMYFRAPSAKPARLTHEEHSPQTIPSRSIWEVRIQKEYVDRETNRNVVD